jgi:hypothetical protein
VKDILETLGVTTLALAALVYIARQIVLHIFTRDLSIHKANLDREVQRQAHELNCLRMQFQIQFSTTYERQVDAIRKLYDEMRRLLYRLNFVSFRITLMNQFKKSELSDIHEAIGEASQVHAAFSKLYEDADIYLPSALSEKVNVFLETSSAPTSKQTLFADHFTKEMVDEWTTQWAGTKPKIEKLMADLKTEFRKLQGIDSLDQYEEET